MITRPILAALVKPNDQPVTGSYQGHFRDLRYPLLCSPKVDGIRALVLDGKVLSRSFKSIPNTWVANHLATLDGLDGELLTYTPEARDDFHVVQSKIMSEDGQPDFRYWVFDAITPLAKFEGFYDRVDSLKRFVEVPNWLGFLPQQVVNNPDELTAFEEVCLQGGWEGVCMRRLDGGYKCGRSTFNEHLLLKLKRFEDTEAIVLRALPLEHNLNPEEMSELGLTKRSSHAAGKVVADLLGAFEVQCPRTGIVFRVGSGYTEHQREEFWQHRDSLVGQTLCYRYQPYGKLVAPRCPIFKGFRYDV